MGWSLLQAGQQSRRNAMNSMATLADEEQKRNATNDQLENQYKQGVMSGVGSGAMMGATVAGPVGALAGGVIGGLASAFF
ncbi:hypothetical protein [Vibrio owensii]|uniref:Bacteriocin n=2 Tax=Vibrio owensii TaxID=696485 RepID=A0AAP9GG09_9VIBR|nr:hypothetical protein [Vibrio owensii]QGH49250.1 bacteriocin [Vibrio owensii]